MPLLTVLPLGVAVALLGLRLPPWLVPAVLASAAVVLVLMLRRQHAIRSGGAAAASAGTTYLCGCFMLVPASGVNLGPGLSVGQVAAFATLLALLMPRTDRRRPRTGQPFALAAGLLLLVGSIIATLWNGTESIGFVGQLIVVVVPIVVAVRRYGPTREEALTILKAWLVGVLLSVVAGLTFATFPSGRAAGFTSHPNQFGMQTAMAIPVVWGLYENGRLNRRQLVLAFVMLWVAVLASGARSGLIAASLGTLLVMLRALGSVSTVVAIAYFGAAGWLLLTSAGSGLVGFGALGRLLDQSSTSASDTGRLELMQDGLERLSAWDTALLGAGWLSYRQPHNLLILVWISAGVIGLVALTILVGVPLARTVNFRLDSLEWALAASALTFLTAVSLNNALMAPFAWAVFALMEFRWSDPSARRPRGQAALSRPAGAVLAGGNAHPPVTGRSA